MRLTDDVGDGIAPADPHRLNAKLSAVSFGQVQMDEAPLLRKIQASTSWSSKTFMASMCGTKGELENMVGICSPMTTSAGAVKASG